MYKFLLIDDEYWTLEGLKKTFTWDKYNVSTADYCTDPIKALELAKVGDYDAIFTDIRMPGLSGIDLIEKCRHAKIDSEFVIISGYGEFEYAKNALKLDVFDYLLKPIDFQIADEMLNRLSLHLYTKKLNSNLILLDALKFNKNKYSHSFIQRNHFLFSNDYQLGWFEQYENSTKISFPDIPNLVWLNFGLNRSLMIFPASQKTTIIEFFQNYRFDFSIGFSTTGTSVNDLPTLINEAFIANSFKFMKQTMTFADYTPLNLKQTKLLLNDLFNLLDLPENSAFLSKLDDFACYCEKERLNMEHIIYFWNQLVAKINFIWDQSTLIEECQITTIEHLKNHFTDITHMIQFIQKMVIDLNQFSNSKTTHSTPLIDQVMIYIELHFSESIQLMDLANLFYINFSYLSTLIKKETGMTFTTYLTDLRMQKAIELYKNKNLSTEEIARLTGYKDYYYFNKVFKKYHGLTPYQYRQTIL